MAYAGIESLLSAQRVFCVFLAFGNAWFNWCVCLVREVSRFFGITVRRSVVCEHLGHAFAGGLVFIWDLPGTCGLELVRMRHGDFSLISRRGFLHAQGYCFACCFLERLYGLREAILTIVWLLISFFYHGHFFVSDVIKVDFLGCLEAFFCRKLIRVGFFNFGSNVWPA